MRGLMLGSIAAMLAALTPVSVLRAQGADSTIRLDQVMSAAEMKATGVSSLTEAQRDSLGSWLARYTATVAGAPGAAPAPGEEERGAEGAEPEYEPSTVSGVRIIRVEQDGTLLTLQDGTRWEVFLPDRPGTATWRRGDFVIVSLSPIMVGLYGAYRYTLEDGRADTRARVKFRGRVRIGS